MEYQSSRPLHCINMILVLSIIAVLSTALLLIWGFLLLGDDWLTFNEDYQSYYLLDTQGLVGVTFILFACAVGPTLLGFALMHLARYLDKHYSLITCGIVSISSIVGLVMVGFTLIDAKGWTFYQGSVPKINVLNQLLGCLVVSVFGWFSMTSFLVLLKVKSFDVFGFTNWNKTSFHVFLLFASFSLFFGLSLILPHIWFISYMPVVSWGAYFVLDSPYSLIRNVTVYRGQTHYTYLNVTDTNNVTTLQYAPDPDW